MASYPHIGSDDEHTLRWREPEPFNLHTAYIKGELTEDSAESDSGSKGGTASSYTLDNYQDDAGITAIYPGAGTCSVPAVNYAILGLIGEAGEIANKWKKLHRDGPNFATDPADYFEYYANLREDILNELGDVLWYAANLSTELGCSLGQVAADNVRKLQKRSREGKLKGSGDNR